ncbi:MAG: hypothetical protein NTV39_02965 [Candidatus Saccharibacteria bacterium]|nr:hypothetical protein [Candidatus Saccharibacteria bacterium]
MDKPSQPSPEFSEQKDKLLPQVSQKVIDAYAEDVGNFDELAILKAMESENPGLTDVVRGYIYAIYEKDKDPNKMRDMCTSAALVYKLLRTQAEVDLMNRSAVADK